MHDTADDAAIIRPLDPAHIRRQMRFDPLPLLIAKPKQVPGHDPNPLPKTNQDRIVRAEKLMSSDPSSSMARLPAPGAAGDGATARAPWLSPASGSRNPPHRCGKKSFHGIAPVFLSWQRWRSQCDLFQRKPLLSCVEQRRLFSRRRQHSRRSRSGSHRCFSGGLRRLRNTARP